MDLPALAVAVFGWVVVLAIAIFLSECSEIVVRMVALVLAIHD